MHRVGSAGNTSSSTRSRKEKRLTFVLNDADDTKVFFLLSPLFRQLLFLFCHVEPLLPSFWSNFFSKEAMAYYLAFGI